MNSSETIWRILNDAFLSFQIEKEWRDAKFRWPNLLYPQREEGGRQGEPMTSRLPALSISPEMCFAGQYKIERSRHAK